LGGEEFKKILVEKPEVSRSLSRTTRIWVNNIKMYLKEIGWGGILGSFGLG
jgi:hypothetical protein